MNSVQEQKKNRRESLKYRLEDKHADGDVKTKSPIFQLDDENDWPILLHFALYSLASRYVCHTVNELQYFFFKKCSPFFLTQICSLLFTVSLS